MDIDGELEMENTLPIELSIEEVLPADYRIKPENQNIKRQIVLPPDQCRTSDWLSVYEIGAIIRIRAAAIESGVEPLIDVKNGEKKITDAITISILELIQKVIPYKVIRVIREIGNDIYVEELPISKAKIDVNHLPIRQYQ